MLILGIDTATRQSSVALLRAEGERLHTVELALLPEGRASETLVPGIAALLARHGVEKSSLGLIAVAAGPGSFTGLRVAIATAKGLAEALAIPAVAVSLLEALALNAGVEGQVVAALDAQRGEVFFGEYIFESGANSASPHPAQTVREDIAALSDFIAELHNLRQAARASGAAEPRVVTSDAALASRLSEAATPEVATVPLTTAEDIARIAHRKFLAGVRADVAALDANYLRRSDAEVVLPRKPGGTV